MKTNETMMQYFEWYLPNDGFWWKRCAAQAKELPEAGVTAVWLPPAYKATSQNDVGYGVYDMYDLGEFDQKGTVRTKYGTKEEYLDAIRAFHEAGIRVYADIVLNHRMGGDETEDVIAVTDSPENRNEQVGGEQTVKVWSKFTFPGRKGKYSSFTWNHTHFTGTDWDENTKRTDQILQSFVAPWFKPLAYAMILLREKGTPCVFYSDYYGNPARDLQSVRIFLMYSGTVRKKSCWMKTEAARSARKAAMSPSGRTNVFWRIWW